ncbi:MAG: hypothetical protein BWX72_01484 [Firmicutes bacterium ADurb.Bin080]|jgi:hypothetical protein|nr:hypothetical protein [Clostridiales bacterium]OQC14063.1 MAG: hypothetical protein BWX72_01484 [Firmicutes bacterium ADurb.Bin080]
MRRSISFVLTLLLLIGSLLLSACNANLSEAELISNIHEEANKTSIKYNEALDLLTASEEYEYTVDIYNETLANFDYTNKEMPNYKDNPEDKKWYKPKITYYYAKISGSEYVKISFTDVQKDESNMPMFEDEKNKNPIFIQESIAEYSKTDGIFTVKVDGIIEFSGASDDFDPSSYDKRVLQLFDVHINPNLILSIMKKYSDLSSFLDSVFSTQNRTLFAQKISLYKTIDIIGNNNDYVPFSLSENAEGLEEDFSVDWQLINGILINNICVTAKRDKVLQVEYNSEIIHSYQRSINQIWNNENVVSWFGDRVEASKMVVEFNYGTNKNPVNIP